MMTKNLPFHMQITQAIVLAAGLGTRLRPLTNHTAKPALTVGGIPILYYNLALLQQYGVKNIVINLHHRPESIRKILSAGGGPASGWRRLRMTSINISFSQEKTLLGTGGGIVKAARLFKTEPFLVLNGDILTNINLAKLIETHFKKQALATLAIVGPDQAKVANYIHYNARGQVLGIGPRDCFADARNDIGLSLRASAKQSRHGIFSGVSIIDPKLLTYFGKKKIGCLIRDLILPAIQDQQKISTYHHKGFWCDLGDLATLKKVNAALGKFNVGQAFQLNDH
ncbi:MAG: NDP-sugar synthase [Deltaproteobacteria bacterium]|nr:NDP-sugar synthase [Deltaproteobacteria bacterium]